MHARFDLARVGVVGIDVVQAFTNEQIFTIPYATRHSYESCRSSTAHESCLLLRMNHAYLLLRMRVKRMRSRRHLR